MYAVGSTVRSCVLLGGFLRDRKAVNAKVVANTCDDKMCPASVDNRGEDEVRTKVPELEACRHGTKGSSRNGEVRMIHQQCASNHRHKHDGPIREGLVGEVRQDDLRCHASKYQRHGQAVQDEMVVFQQM